jgi:hypothetical protein
MRSRDVVQLFDIVGRGAQVSIIDAPLETFVPGLASETRPIATNAPRAGMVIR